MPTIIPSMTLPTNNTPPLSRASSPSIRSIKSALKSSNGSSSFSETMYKAYIQNALDEVSNKNLEPITKIVNQLSLPPSSAESMTNDQLLYLIKTLTSEVSRLDSRACVPLIEAILRLKWSDKDTQFISCYIRFLGVLVSSIPKWWSEVADGIVAEFILENTSSHHSVLGYILKIIPTSLHTINSIFIKNFPHKSERTKCYVNYVKNLLKTVEYCHELERPVWSLIFEKCVQLDVELYEELDDEEEEDDDEDDEEEDGVVLESENKLIEEEEDDYEDDHDLSEYEVGDIDSSTLEIRKKLDLIMCYLFNYLDTKFNPQQISSPETIQLFNTLIDHFQTFILPTHRTRSIQYLIFRTCHAHPDLLDAFLVSMIELALSPSDNIEKRIKAMQYISSFIARAKGLSRPQIIFVVSFLTGWLDRYIREREIEVDNVMGGMGRFKMFYSVCQALFYIFCFRHELLKKDTSEDNEKDNKPESSSSDWECDLDHLFQRLIVTKFNPLRYCKRTVVAMFAQIAQKENVAYCFTIIEQNRLGGFRSGNTSTINSCSNSTLTTPISGYSGTSYFGAGSTFWSKTQEFVALEGYFPFDPLALSRASKYISDLYVEWDDVAEDLSDNSDDDNDNENDDSDSDQMDDDDDEADSDIDMSDSD